MKLTIAWLAVIILAPIITILQFFGWVQNPKKTREWVESVLTNILEWGRG